MRRDRDERRAQQRRAAARDQGAERVGDGDERDARDELEYANEADNSGERQLELGKLNASSGSGGSGDGDDTTEMDLEGGAPGP